MGKQEQYIRNRDKLLADKKICGANRKLFKKFFEQEEYKLKRKNGLKELDNASYKTMCAYISYLRNVSKWFKNKEWKKLTKKEIQKVYDDLEDGKLKGMNGNIITSKTDYYDKVFKSLPFELAGKTLICKEVMRYYDNRKKEEVRFFEEETFKKIANATGTIKQRLLCWLAWDIGENIFTLLQLQKRDFVKQANPKTKDNEYIVNLPKDKIKRTRRSRSEITNYTQTADLLDSVLSALENEEDNLFHFGHRNALKFLDKAVKKANAQCIPQGQKVSWKDFRSSMACHLLKIGWTTDEIKARLGHSPSSKMLDKYVNYLAIGRHKPKVKIQESQIAQISEELEKIKYRERLQQRRNERMVLELAHQDKKLINFAIAFKMISEGKKVPFVENKVFYP